MVWNKVKEKNMMVITQKRGKKEEEKGKKEKNLIAICIWLQNVKRQVDKVSDPQHIRLEAEKRGDVVCVSALSGDGLDEFCDAVQGKLKVY